MLMIKDFKHKGLRKFFETGSAEGIDSRLASKLRLRLASLDAADVVEDLDLPGYRLHPLKGDRRGIWSVTITGNWRVTFEFFDGNAYIVDYEDYH